MHEDHVLLVTGAASGIGKAVALEFAAVGYRVFLVDCNEELLAKTIRQEFRSYLAGYHCGDVSRPADVEAGLAKCLSEFGQVDVLVSNAAVMDKASLLAMREDQWDRTIAVNLKGTFLWGQAVARWMVQTKKPGHIINIGCMRAELATSSLSAYISSKGAVTHLTQAMAVELAPFGINVNAVAPGRTLTEGTAVFFQNAERRKHLEALIPLHHLADPKEIAGVVRFLASDEARYITGAIIPVDGGYTCCKE